MIFLLDTRNQKDDFVVKSLEALGQTVVRTKLPFGDVATPTNLFNAIDLKSSGGGIIELARNRCSKDHNRMKNEILNCLSVGGKITFMCFEPNITKLEDIKNWQSPKFKGDLYKTVQHEDGSYSKICLHLKGQPMCRTNPETLIKSLQTMTTQDHYGKDFKVDLVFATKQNCGQKIIDILCK